MLIHRVTAAALAAASVFAVAQASAQVQFAAQTGVAILAPCPSFCGGPGGRFAFDGDGGETFSSADSSASNADGNGQAHADLTGPTGLGILKAEAQSLGSSRASALASTMQGFHVGPGGLGSYTLEASLTGQATGSAHATVAIFRDTDPGSEFSYSEDGPTMFLEVYPNTPDLDKLQTIDLDLPADGSPHSVSDAITIAGLRQGDLFYVWATLEVVGLHGTYADAFHSVNMAFTDPRGLSQTAAVPEPATWAMLVAGFGALMLSYRSGPWPPLGPMARGGGPARSTNKGRAPCISPGDRPRNVGAGHARENADSGRYASTSSTAFAAMGRSYKNRRFDHNTGITSPASPA